MAAKKPGKVDIFASAAAVEAAPIDPFKVKKKKGPEEVDMGPALDLLAAIKHVTKALSGVAESVDGEVKAKMSQEFALRAIAAGRQPENFKGVSDAAEASCQLKERSERSRLSDDEKDLLERHAVPVKKLVVTEAIPERFFFNPELVADAKLAAKISEALSKVPELAEKQVMMRQVPREEQAAWVVGEGALDAVAKLKDRNVVAELLKVAGSLAIRCDLKDADMETAFAVIRAAGVLNVEKALKK